jgi:DNA-binding NarL/FixJ family response regulator
MIKIILVDSNKEYRNDLFASLSCQEDFTVAGLGKDGYEAIRLTEQLRPDIVLLEQELPPLNGIKTATMLKCRSPSTAVVILSSGNESRTMFQAFNNCIAGCIGKAAGFEQLYLAIRLVYHGGRLITPEIAAQMAKIASQNSLLKKGEALPDQKRQEVPASISRSELKIMDSIGRGLTNREIAEQLSLREGTVRNYISSVLQKIGLRDRTQVAIYALQHDLAAD